ncbi:hypothetical protein GJAV_G00050130 [Gymnothorax javanicus]|nr:hypothetical protein GJAV_G00050130 [Gymnothorax javanicus]
MARTVSRVAQQKGMDSPEDSQGEEQKGMDSPGDSQGEEDGHAPVSFSQFSSKLRAMMRIRSKYLAIKRRKADLTFSNQGSIFQNRSTSPKIFTFDGVAAISGDLSSTRRKKKKRKKRVLFPSDSRRRAAPTERSSRAKYCLLLLSCIVCLQVYNAIENLDDHILRYDLEGLGKTMRREVFGQREATDRLLEHLRDYLSTYVHNKPLMLSLHGPSGVGKSHLGRILARHFRSVLGEELVLQYFALHHCPLEAKAENCAQELSQSITRMLELAEEEEKIPVFIFDEMEFMHRPLLNALHDLYRPDHSAESLNAVYLLIGNFGQAEITRYVLQNTSSSGVPLGPELGPVLRTVLEKQHPLWGEADIKLVPLMLLEKSHVMECFLYEMTQEGFYPDRAHIERLASEIQYYTVGDREFSQMGCKQVVAKVNLL